MNQAFNRSKLAASAFALLAVFFAASAFAIGVVQAVKGNARAEININQHGPVVPNMQLLPGTKISTGPDAQVVIRFDDGSQAVLNQNTEFKITEFSYEEAKPSGDRSVLDLFKGAMRYITGALGHRSRDAFALRVPQATIGIRGTDFSFAIVNQSAFGSVSEGAISVSNAGGTAVFGPGSTIAVSSSSALATSVSPSSLPAGASDAFGTMSEAPVSAAGGAASGAAGGAAGAAGGVGLGTAAAVGAVAAGVAAASGSDSNNSTTTHH